MPMLWWLPMIILSGMMHLDEKPNEDSSVEHDDEEIAAAPRAAA